MAESGAPVELTGCQGLAAGRALGPVWAMASDPGAGEGPPPLEPARRAARDLLRGLAADTRRSAAEAAILSAQAEMLDDPALRQAVDGLLPTLGPAAAVRSATERFATALEALDDPYLAARAHDVREVADLWLARTAGEGRAASGPEVPSVVVTARLGVGWLLAQPPGHVLAVVARHASRTMHSTIVASGLGIPVVAVASDLDLAACARAGSVLVDGTTGRVQLDPRSRPEPRPEPIGHAGMVRLGTEVLEVRANVADAADVRAALEAGADGVGLFRTELAFARAGRVLSCPEQEALYEEAVVAAGGRPITFRTLDLGADKPLPGLTLPSEPNPQLGVRGVRLYRREPDLLDQQLRALGRVGSRHSGVEVMFPMVASPDDWNLCRTAAERAFDQVDVGPNRPRLGVMLETPSALLWLPELVAAGVAFVSLGTNDLLQYILAQDREQAALPVPRVPVALLRLLDHTLTVAAAAVPVAMCGEAAADPLAAPLYALVGVREFSVPAPCVESTKRALGALGRRADWAGRLRPVLGSATDQAAEAALRACAWWLEA